MQRARERGNRIIHRSDVHTGLWRTKMDWPRRRRYQQRNGYTLKCGSPKCGQWQRTAKVTKDRACKGLLR